MPENALKSAENSASLTGDISTQATKTEGKIKKPMFGGVLKFKKKTPDQGAKRNRKVKLSNSSRFAYPVTIFLIVLVLIWFMSFLYSNVYETIALGQNITNLKVLVINQNLNETEFNKILALNKNKTAGASWRADRINNPFIYSVRILTSSATAAPASATSTALNLNISTTTKATTTIK